MGDKYKDIKQKVIIWMQQNEKIVADSSFIITAAEYDEAAFLQQFQSYTKLIVPVMVVNEINGKITYGGVGYSVNKLLNAFLKVTQGKIDYHISQARVNELNPLVPLLPRCVATLAIGNFVGKLIEVYAKYSNQASLPTTQESLRLSKEYEKGYELLMPQCEDRYFQLIDKPGRI